jgi:hypothetical protein
MKGLKRSRSDATADADGDAEMVDGNDVQFEGDVGKKPRI